MGQITSSFDYLHEFDGGTVDPFFMVVRPLFWNVREKKKEARHLKGRFLLAIKVSKHEGVFLLMNVLCLSI
jgi:hypothetical protein